MSKRQRTRYIIAIYTIVAAVAVIFLLLAFNRTNDTWQSTLLNLSTELFGVVFIFFLVNFLFLMDDWNLSDRVEQLISRLDDNIGLLRGSEHNPNFKTLIEGKTDIALLSYTAANILRTHHESISKRILNGARFRIILVNPDSNAAKVILENSRIRNYETDIQHSLHFLKRMRNDTSSTKRGSIEVRLTSWIPSCSLLLVNTNKPDGYIRVGIYPPNYISSADKRSHFVLNRQLDEKWYTLYSQQFEGLWEQATTYELDESSSTNDIPT